MSAASFITSIRSQFKTWGLAEVILVAIILGASFVRLWNLTGSLQFQGDQGRDAIIVSRIFTQGDLVFIGPVTSVGNMYLGPLYYYFMVPFLALTYPSPAGPAYAVAALGILTTLLVYYLGKDLLQNKTVALFATSIFAFTTVVIIYSRFSWNPNLAPLFGLLMVWCTYKAWTKSVWYWLGVALSFSVLLQLHYLTLLALPASGLIWLIQLWQMIQTMRTKHTTADWKNLRNFVLATLGAIGIVLLSFTPLILFDTKHNWLNTQAFIDLITNKENIGGAARGLDRVIEIAKETHGRSMHILFDLFIGQDRSRNTYLVIGVILGTIYSIAHAQGKYRSALVVLASFVGIAILGTAVYQHTLFDHYLGYLYAIVPLLLAGILLPLAKSKLGTVVLLGIAVLYFAINAPRFPLASLGWTIYDIDRTSQVIADHVAPGEKYNIILLAESHDLYGQNYRYFLTTTATPPVDPENFAEADKLFIINENQPGVDIAQLPIYEIQTFPNKTIRNVYTVEGGPQILELER